MSPLRSSLRHVLVPRWNLVGPRLHLWRLLSTFSVLSLACSEDSQSPEPPEPPSGLALASGSPSLAFQQISLGLLHTCGLTTAGRAYC